MYDQIFDDFNAIKQHCERNGNVAFDESLVFELLEKYFPKYGSQQSIQKVLNMLAVQREREEYADNCVIVDTEDEVGLVKVKDEIKNLPSSIDDAYNSESNDSDSIIEVEVPKKTFPFIDLTDNSPESDVIIDEKTSPVRSPSDTLFLRSIGNDNINDNYDNNSTTIDLLNDKYDCPWPKPNEDDNEDRSNDVNDEGIMDRLHLLADIDVLVQNTIGRSLNDHVEISEMLEVNNNDPNNNSNNRNLEGAIHEEPRIVEDANPTRIVPMNNRLADRDDQYSPLIAVRPTDSAFELFPRCSKDTDRDVIDRIYKNNRKTFPNAHSPMSPVAGCSKDFHLSDSSDNSKSDDAFDNDESIQNDLMCIQEIIPWAEREEILELLKQNYMEDKRKEITLWKLMKSQTNESKNFKRKSLYQNCLSESSPKKSKRFESSHPRGFLDKLLDDRDEISSNKPIDQEPDLEAPSVNQNDLDSMLSLEKPDLEAPSVNQNNQGTVISQNNDQTNKTATGTSDSNVSLSNKNIKEALIKRPTAASAEISNKSKPTDSFEKKPLFTPRLLNSNNVNNDTFELDDFDVLKNIIPIDKKEEYLLTRSFNPLLKSEPYNPPKLQSQPGGSNVKSEKSSTIVRPSRLNLSPSPAVMEPKLRPGPSDIIQQARLSYLYPAHENLEVLRKNLWTASSFKEREKEKEELKRVPEAKLIKAPILKDVPPYFVQNINYRASQVPALHRAVNTQPSATITSSVFGASVRNNTLQTTATNVQPERPSTIANSTVDNQASTSGTSNATNTAPKQVEVPHSVYVKLRSMFSEVKKSYIKKICTNPPIPMNSNNEQYILNLLIDHLLREGSNNLEIQQMQDFAPENTTSSLTVDEKYEYLVGIFPNADPTYLREFVEKETTTDQAIKDFIEQKIETHDYPTKQDYLKKIKITEQIRQYTTNFNVENFLKLFPDPIKHFEDSNRQNTYQLIAMEFLKSHFNRYKICTLNKLYRSNRYNLSLTAKLLSEMSPDMKSKRGNSEMPTENIPLLQEIAFVRNKKKILDHIEAMKKQEEVTFNELKEKGLLLTCLCCYNDECMPSKSSECNAKHVFCYECIVRGTEAALADGNAHVRCFTDCQSDFSLATLQKVLPPTQFSSLLMKRQAAEVAAAAVEGLVSCPFCYFASIPPPEDKVFKCLNPECMKESCRLCKELNHVPLRCDEVIKTDKARLMIEEKMTEALLRTCYQCKKQFYKEEGCNKMRCPCGALMCYVCDKPVKGYDHFNAQGGANSALCPLWSDDRRLNAESVRKVAEEVKNSILKQNPNLKIDTESLMPKLPPKSRGPHDDIPNANQIHEHVRRVANAP